MNTDFSDPDIFISHASEDKESVARPLCKVLRSLGISVWLDENELALGDSLGREIDKGLTTCRYGVVILSPAFLNKEWPRRELNALIAREVSDQKIVLPVWYGVTKEMVANSYPALAERKYVTVDGGVEMVAESILKLLQQDAFRTTRTAVKVTEELSGEWDAKKAEPLILGILKKREKEIRDPFYSRRRLPWQKLPMVNRVLRDYYLRYRKRETMIAVTTSLEKGVDCHACAPRLSLFEFARTQSGWALVDCSLAVTSWGTWGDVSADEVKVFAIGDDNYALFLDGGFTNQGITTTTTCIHARVGDLYREILDLQTSKCDASGLTAEPESFTSVIKIVPGTSAFYDLLVERKGERKNRSFEESELFRFNGQKYCSDSLYR